MSQAHISGFPGRSEGVKLSRPDNIHVSTYGLRPRVKTKETTITVLCIPSGSTKGGRVLCPTIQDGYTSDP